MDTKPFALIYPVLGSLFAILVTDNKRTGRERGRPILTCIAPMVLPASKAVRVLIQLSPRYVCSSSCSRLSPLSLFYLRMIAENIDLRVNGDLKDAWYFLCKRISFLRTMATQRTYILLSENNVNVVVFVVLH